MNPLVVTDPYNVPVVFVNDVVGSGMLNGTVNVTLAVARFSPNSEGKIDPDLVIASRLRMDLYCCKSLHDALGKILENNTKPTKTN